MAGGITTSSRHKAALLTLRAGTVPRTLEAFVFRDPLNHHAQPRLLITDCLPSVANLSRDPAQPVTAPRPVPARSDPVFDVLDHPPVRSAPGRSLKPCDPEARALPNCRAVLDPVLTSWRQRSQPTSRPRLLPTFPVRPNLSFKPTGSRSFACLQLQAGALPKRPGWLNSNVRKSSNF